MTADTVAISALDDPSALGFPAPPAAVAPAQAGEGAPPLIGADDVTAPYWVQINELVASARISAVLRSIPEVTMTTARWAWRVGPWLTVLAGVLELASGAVTAFGLLSTANVFTRLLAEGPAPGRLIAALPAIGLVVAAQIAGTLLSTATDYVQAVLAPRVEQAAEDDLHEAVVAMDVIAFEDSDFVELTNKAENATARLRATVGTVGNLISSLVSMAAAVVTATLLHPALAPLVLLTALPQAWASVRAARINNHAYIAMSSRMRRLSATRCLLMNPAEAAEVRAYTAGPLLLAEHRRIAASLLREGLATHRRVTRVQLVGRGMSGVASGIAYLVLGTLVYVGALPLAIAGTAVLAMRTAAGAVASTMHSANNLYEASFYLELYRICLADARTRTRPAARETAIPGPVPVDQSVEGPHIIELRDVTFRYPGQNRPAVANVSLTLRAGQITALVGENGSGKSTLAALISGLYLPEAGTITWDGVDITTIDPEQLHSRLALVLQSPTRWPMTAANNIRIGRPDQPDPDGRRLTAAAEGAGAGRVITGLDNGWHTMLSPRFHAGQSLSGGQWQRISIARGLYRDAGLVIADEPSAALDAKAEHRVFATLRRLHESEHDFDHRDRITVLITHRLANIRGVHHIAVLDHGRLTDQGTHDELMTRPSTYTELFSLQANSYAAERAL